MEQMTYWLHNGGNVITSVRARPGLDRGTVIGMALESHAKVPLIDRPYENPVDKARRISQSTIVIYPGGN